MLLAGAAAGGWYYFRPAPARADVLLHTVKREPLVVTVAEKGTLESADNRDIVCKVRAGTKGFASTINWVIDDGSRVKPGQLLMILDDSALKDQEDDQQIKVQSALAAKVKAERGTRWPWPRSSWRSSPASTSTRPGPPSRPSAAGWRPCPRPARTGRSWTT